MPSIMELQEQRAEAITTLEQLRDVEDWTPQHEEQWQQANTRYEEIANQWREAVNGEEQRKARSERLAEIRKEMQARADSRKAADFFQPDAVENRAQKAEEMRMLALGAWLTTQSGRRVPEEMRGACDQLGLDPRSSTFEVNAYTNDNIRGFGGWATCGGVAHVQSGIQAYLKRFEGDERPRLLDPFHKRDLGTTPGSAGGYTIPQGFQYELERAMLSFGGIRRVCRVWSTAGFDPIPWPTVTDVNNKGDIINEATDYGSSVDPTFGEVVFNTYKLTSFPVVVSQELIEDSFTSMPALLGSMLGERISRGLADYLAQGTGVGQPEGIITNAPVGHTAASATDLTFDDLIDTIHSVDPSYRGFPSTGFLFTDLTLSVLRKLKDLEGRYYWQPGTVAAEPDRLFGYPYQVDQALPEIGSATKPVVFGALEKFVIRDHASYRFYQLNEKYRNTDQTGFVSFSRHDSHLIDAGTGPIKVLQMAA